MDLNIYISVYNKAFLQYLIIIAIQLVFLPCGSSQIEQLTFDHLSEQHGLNGTFTDFIKKDSRGFLWLSSINGLFRYDGLEIIHYTEESHGILDNNIQSDFFEDAEGNIWFATVTGINCYRRKTEAFDSFRLKKADHSEYENGYTIIYLEVDDILWIKAGNSIFRYNIKTQEQEKIVDRTLGVRFAVTTNRLGHVKKIIACPWLNIQGVELITIDSLSQKGKTLHFLKNGLPHHSNLTLEISRAYAENDTLIWLGFEKGLLAFNPKKPNETSPYFFPNKESLFAIDITLSVNNQLLITTKKGGLWVFNQNHRTFTSSITNTPEAPYGITTNSLNKAYIDPQKHLWVSNTFKAAIDHVWINQNKFYNPFLNKVEPLPVINSIVEDEENRIWCTSGLQGIYIFNQKGDSIDHISYTTTGGELPPIQRLSIDKNGKLWALGSNDIFILDQNKWQNVYRSTKNRLFDLIHVDAKSKVLATNSGILAFFYNEGKKLQFKDTIGLNRAFKGFYNNNGDTAKLYFPLQEQELAIFKIEKVGFSFSETQRYKVGKGVYSLYKEAEHSKIILGTTKGLAFLDNNSNEVQDFLLENTNLNAATIYGIVKDENNKFWYITNNGIFTKKENSDEVFFFGKNDGLPTLQFSQHATLKASDGKIWVGTNNGLIYFHPDSINVNPGSPQIQLKSLMVNGKNYSTELNLGEIKEFNLKPFEKDLDFRLIALTSHLPAENKIFYRLKSYRDDWNQMDNGTLASFTKLPPGNYTLEAYGINANGLKGKVKSFKVSIEVPFWQTWWFWLIIINLVGAIILVSNRVYARRKLREQKKVFEQERALQTALQSERNRISADMHDDLGGGLTSISLIINRIRNKKLDKKDAYEYLDKADLQAKNLITSMRELIWVLNGNNDNLQEVIAYLRKFVVVFFDQQKIECTADTPKIIPEEIISSRIRRNVFLCVKEATHNILKHANATQVTFKIELGNDQLFVKIKDNGKGIDWTEKEEFGNGLINLEKRIKELNGEITIKNDNGTSVEFSVPFKSNVS